MLNTLPPKPDDPFESEEYARFVEEMAKSCRCAPSVRPCDGVLAGGVCDGLGLQDYHSQERDYDDPED